MSSGYHNDPERFEQGKKYRINSKSGMELINDDFYGNNHETQIVRYFKNDDHETINEKIYK